MNRQEFKTQRALGTIQNQFGIQSIHHQPSDDESTIHVITVEIVVPRSIYYIDTMTLDKYVLDWIEDHLPEKE